MTVSVEIQRTDLPPGNWRDRQWPACWEWPVKPLVPIQPGEADTRFAVRQWRHLEAWQDGRCAICAVRPTKRLVYDHDHETGRGRGLLCSRCNTCEGGRNPIPLFAAYRHRYPALILGLDDWDTGRTLAPLVDLLADSPPHHPCTCQTQEKMLSASRRLSGIPGSVMMQVDEDLTLARGLVAAMRRGALADPGPLLDIIERISGRAEALAEMVPVPSFRAEQVEILARTLAYQNGDGDIYDGTSADPVDPTFVRDAFRAEAELLLAALDQGAAIIPGSE